MIGFIAAERREFDGLLQHVENLRRLERPIEYAAVGTLRGEAVALAANGPGPELAKQAVEELKAGRLDILVSIGFCGALAPELRACGVFVATSVNGVPVDAPRQAPVSARGPLLSVSRVIATSGGKAQLRSGGVDVVEMEAAQVSLSARETGAGFHCIRVITDTAEENLPMDFNLVRDSSGRFSRARILARAFRSPFRLFPRLIQLDRRCRSAAFVLGDFIADCQF